MRITVGVEGNESGRAAGHETYRGVVPVRASIWTHCLRRQERVGRLTLHGVKGAFYPSHYYFTVVVVLQSSTLLRLRLLASLVGTRRIRKQGA